jgi:hypothetical protein
MSALFRLPLLHPPVWREPVRREPVPKPIPIIVKEPDGPRPMKREDCLTGGANAQRPCRWHSCRYHLSSTTTAGREIPTEPGVLNPTCALDVADRGEHSLEEVGEILGVTRERIRQIEAVALAKLKKKGILLEFRKD